MEAQTVSCLNGDPTLPNTSMHVVPLGLVPGLLPPGVHRHTHPLASLSGGPPTPPPLAHFGAVILHATCVARSSIVGETTTSRALAVATGSFATTPSATSCAPRSLNHFGLSWIRKPGLLLPPHPPDPSGTGSELDHGFDPRPLVHEGGRRPADVLPSVAGVFDEVETRKRSFHDTASQVASLGTTFCPLVLEACGGGWSQALRGVVAWISSESRSQRGVAGNTPRDTSLRIGQRVSRTLHRENARAILRRSPLAVNGSPGLVGDEIDGSGWSSLSFVSTACPCSRPSRPSGASLSVVRASLCPLGVCWHCLSGGFTVCELFFFSALLKNLPFSLECRPFSKRCIWHVSLCSRQQSWR